MLYWFIKRDCPEFTIPWFWVQSLVYIVIQLNIEYFSVVVYNTIVKGRCNILSTLFSHIRMEVSCLTDVRFLPLRSHIFELRTVKRNNRIVLIYAFTFILDLCYILLSTFVSEDWQRPRTVHARCRRMTSHLVFLVTIIIDDVTDNRIINHINVENQSYI